MAVRLVRLVRLVRPGRPGKAGLQEYGTTGAFRARSRPETGSTTFAGGPPRPPRRVVLPVRASPCTCAHMCVRVCVFLARARARLSLCGNVRARAPTCVCVWRRGLWRCLCVCMFNAMDHPDTGSTTFPGGPSRPPGRVVVPVCGRLLTRSAPVVR